jgi:hypothetical protein
MQVRVFNGVNWSPWSNSSNQFRPYGATNAPVDKGASTSGRTITYKWSWATNGRDATSFQIYRGGSRIATVSGGSRQWSHTWPAYSTTYAIQVFAVAKDSGRSKGAATISGKTGPKPNPPSITVHKGSKCPAGGCHTASGSCTSSNCYYIAVTSNNLPSSKNCHFQRNGRDVGGWVDMTIGKNQTKDSINYYGYPGDTISANCGGYRDSVPW